MSFIIPGLLAAGEELLSAAGSYLLPKLGEAAVSYILDKTANSPNITGYQASTGVPAVVPPPVKAPVQPPAKPAVIPTVQPPVQHGLSLVVKPQNPPQTNIMSLMPQPIIERQDYARGVAPIKYDYSIGTSGALPTVKERKTYTRKNVNMNSPEAIALEIKRLKKLKKDRKSVV